MAESTKDLKEYWRRNMKITLILLGVWFTAGYVLPIFLVEPLNKIPFFGFKLGFWFAHQGGMYIMVALIFIYCYLMIKLDKEFDVHE